MNFKQSALGLSLMLATIVVHLNAADSPPSGLAKRLDVPGQFQSELSDKQMVFISTIAELNNKILQINLDIKNIDLQIQTPVSENEKAKLETEKHALMLSLKQANLDYEKDKLEEIRKTMITKEQALTGAEKEAQEQRIDKLQDTITKLREELELFKNKNS